MIGCRWFLMSCCQAYMSVLFCSLFVFTTYLCRICLVVCKCRLSVAVELFHLSVCCPTRNPLVSMLLFLLAPFQTKFGGGVRLNLDSPTSYGDCLQVKWEYYQNCFILRMCYLFNVTVNNDSSYGPVRTVESLPFMFWR